MYLRISKIFFIGEEDAYTRSKKSIKKCMGLYLG